MPTPRACPNALLHNLMHNKVLHERVVLVSVQFYDVPFVPDIDRVEVRKLKENFWTVIVQYGFKDEPDIPAAMALCVDSGPGAEQHGHFLLPRPGKP